MSVFVFVGPTMPAAEALAELRGLPDGPGQDVVVCGPASFGDVCRATESRPIAVAIIDGYFERVPAVWHKEILWAMSEGVHVFGSSSMGALRAAELSDFGMVGIGEIYEAFQRGALEDDDEVAVVHGPAEDGYPALSEAMVNIRATLVAATAQGILDEAAAEALIEMAKGRFYGDRSYPALFVEAGARGVDFRALEALRAWLPRGRVDQKREDALLLLRHLRGWLAAGPAGKRVAYRFEPTDAWLEARRTALAGFTGAGESGSEGPPEGVLEELRVSGVYASARDGATARAAGIDQARDAAVRPDGLAVRSAIEELRRERGLLDRAAFEEWRVEQRLDEAEVSRFFEDQARLLWSRPVTRHAAREHLVDHLRAKGEYGRLTARAEAKARRLAELGVNVPSLADAGMTERGLWEWYFGEVLRVPVPANLEAFADAAGFSGKDDMRGAVLREVCYRRRGGA
ncbi:MAG TPA: TfuA-like protein [Polyangiaceae bacterium]|jgi:hypothetical protein